MIKKINRYDYRLLAVVIFILLALFIAAIFEIDSCPIKNLFGIPCPGCGMGRALRSVFDLNFNQAFYYHPLWPIVIIIFIILIISFLRNNFQALNKKEYIYSVSLLFFIVYIWRFISQFNQGAMTLKTPLIVRLFRFLFDLFN